MDVDHDSAGNALPNQADVKAGTLAFWNATLRKDDSARRWLADGGYRAALLPADRFASK